jgi:hypothetical protein
MDLVVFLGSDRETWGQPTALINRGDWEKVLILKNKVVSGFPIPTNGELIEIDSDKPLSDLKDEIKEKLKKSLSNDFEVAVSIASGNGKEHMALISAIIGIPLGIKLVAFTKKGIEFLD